MEVIRIEEDISYGLAVDSTASRQVIRWENHLQEIQEVLWMGVGSESHSRRAYWKDFIV